MRRRDFVVALGSALAYPVLGHAQPASGTKRIAVVMSSGERDPLGQARAAALVRGLMRVGWVEGRNLRIDWRWTAGDAALVRQHAAEVVRDAPDMIVANGTPVITAFKAATQTIPTLFIVVNDPVAQGFIQSMARPGGNITGFSFLEYSTVAKSLELLKRIAPNMVRVSMMYNPDTYPYYDKFLASFEDTARRMGIAVVGVPVRNPAAIEAAIAEIGKLPGQGIIVPPDPFTMVNRAPIIRLANDQKVPAIHFFRTFVAEGALVSYGADTVDMFDKAADYIDLILKGANPGELPVQAPTKYETAINLKVAAALGLNVPADLIALADEVVR
jgi:putative ABC transport system substrate-binding protein